MLKGLVLATIIALLPVAATAAPPCQQQFEGGVAPALINPKLAARTTRLCFSAYAALYSGVTRTPLYSAEHLTKDRLESAKRVRRRNAFHEEPRLSRADRSELADYARSGFDRGHMAPSGDMPDPESQYESFSLANMIPQNPDNNRHLWEGVETAVRDIALYDGDLYVITGPIFLGTTVERLHGRVLVPTGIFKAIYDPRRNTAGAYVVDNAPGNRWKAISIAELTQSTGIDVFPALPPDIKEHAMTLPRPEPYGHRNRRSSGGFER